MVNPTVKYTEPPCEKKKELLFLQEWSALFVGGPLYSVPNCWVASQLWLTGRGKDNSGGVVTPATALTSSLVGPLNARNTLAMEAIVVERRTILVQANGSLHYITSTKLHSAG